MQDINVMLTRYEKRFGDIFPTMSFMNSTEEEWMEKIKECLDKNKSAVELYNLKSDGSIKY